MIKKPSVFLLILGFFLESSGRLHSQEILVDEYKITNEGFIYDGNDLDKAYADNTATRFDYSIGNTDINTVISNSLLTFETDFSDSTLAREAMHYHMDIFNRISPINGFRLPATANAKLCIVRPLGGKYKDGTANISEDTYLWDEVNRKFYTDFTLLKKQIDGVFSRGIGFYQIVLDNPSWAFQRDSLGNLNGNALSISTYGNAEPPRDFDVWASYLKEVMGFLVNTYGQERMLQIQFGIGREIGTEGHWKGTKEQFFEFYKKSVTAIHEVLPEAKIGSHFLWGTSSKSWAVDFVKWCKTNNVHYDFLGVSYYPFYNRTDRTNFTQVYTNDFGVIKDIPEWNENAKLEIHEFALIERMIPPGNAYDSAPAEHQNSFLVGLMKMFHENNMHNLFLWGTGSQYMPASTEISNMKGNIYFKSTKNGTQQSQGNYTDAIFAKDTANRKYNIMVYNYNASPSSNTTENIKINATIDVPPGTDISFRLATYNKSNNSLPWSDWQNLTTQGTSEDKSTVSFNTQLPVFSFLKYEIVENNTMKPDSLDVNSMIEKLIFYCPLESDGTDLSGNENHAIPGSAVTFATGKFGNAAAFSNTLGSYLTSADSIYWYSYPTAYTIAFWLKVSDYSVRGDILQPAQGRTLLYSNGDMTFRSFHQKNAASFSIDDNEKNEWFHVAMVIDQREGQTQHKFYINGIQRGDNPSGYALETDKPQSISRLVFGAASDMALSRNLTGMIDEIYMFNDVLSDDEITFLMNTTNLMLPSGSTLTSSINTSKYSIYPNPVINTIYLEGENIISTQIYCASSMLLMDYAKSSRGLDVSSLNKGFYILKIVGLNGVIENFKFIKL